jgi:hypothetical protein
MVELLRRHAQDLADYLNNNVLDCPWPCETPRWWPRKVLAVDW